MAFANEGSWDRTLRMIVGAALLVGRLPARPP